MAFFLGLRCAAAASENDKNADLFYNEAQNLLSRMGKTRVLRMEPNEIIETCVVTSAVLTRQLFKWAVEEAKK